MRSLADATWPDLDALRARVGDVSTASHLEGAAQAFCELFSSTYESVVLARLFLVLPFGKLPEPERAFAERLAKGAPGLNDKTLVLSLLGTCGKMAGWSARRRSAGHLAIPLLDSASVAAAPMIAKLLSDLDVDLRALDDGRPIATRPMLGGKNGIFYVGDARASVDARGRRIVPAEDFVRQHGIVTVFGMGGAYVDGTLTVMVLFCNEALERAVVDRFGSFIASFKMATTALLQESPIFSS